MKAVSIQKFGDPSVLNVVEADQPQVGENDVLIRVEAVGVNYGDLVVRSGGAPIPIPMPFIPGCEVAGVVVQTGAAVTSVKAGARVVAPIFLTGRLNGGYAEAAAIDAAFAFPLPEEVDFSQAVALAMQGLTAWLMLRQSRVQGRTVLVHAAAGGVGSLLLQLAKLQGARIVIATAGSSEKLDLAARLGADIAISYRDDDWSDQVKARTDGAGPALIFESVGGDIRRQSLDILAPSGELVIYGGTAVGGFFDDPLDGAQVGNLIVRNQAVRGFSMWPLLPDRDAARQLVGSIFDALFDLVRERKLNPVIGGRYPLEEAALVHKGMEERQTVGKSVLLPFPNT